MVEEIKLAIKSKKTTLPILAYYWDVKEQKETSVDDQINVVSQFHQTSEYRTQLFYKPLSTALDLSYYEGY